ncbi:hypothetical protein [Photorhabdus sp. RM71S]
MACLCGHGGVYRQSTPTGYASIELTRFATIYPASLWAKSPAP